MQLINGDCLEQLKLLPANSIDSLVTDPPAGISFMGKDWDKDKGGRDAWVGWMTDVMRECHRVMKPGAHGLVWAIPRTSHWMAWAAEDAGFTVREKIYHLFGSGFPKSTDISKQLDKAAGAERVVMGERSTNLNRPITEAWQKSAAGKESVAFGDGKGQIVQVTAPATDAAKQWAGWGSALKPACEEWIMIRKPLEKGLTISQNVLKWGVGGINVDASRVAHASELDRANATPQGKVIRNNFGNPGEGKETNRPDTTIGRFPANLILSHTDHCTDSQCDIECAVKLLDEQSGVLRARGNKTAKDHGSDYNASSYQFGGLESGNSGDSGGASRFFYVAKAAKREKNAGLEGMPKIKGGSMNGEETREGKPTNHPYNENFHPTVKSLKLMSYLCRMITPPGGTVLDCFMGSGSTGCAAIAGGWEFIGIEKDPEYFKIAERRVFNALPKMEKQYALE